MFPADAGNKLQPATWQRKTFGAKDLAAQHSAAKSAEMIERDAEAAAGDFHSSGAENDSHRQQRYPVKDSVGGAELGPPDGMFILIF